MKKRWILLFIGCTLLPCYTCSILEPEVEKYHDLDEEIRNEVIQNRIPCLAACVIKDGSIVWQGYYGFMDRERQEIPDDNTIFGLASISKLVVVTAVMQLHEQGLINLDTDVNDYLPFAVRNPNYPEEKITTYHLLTHTSGLNWPESEEEVPGFYDFYPLDTAPPLREWLPEFVLTEGAHYVPAVWLNSRPGAREWYSNIGTAILAYLVEVVSETNFNLYCKQHIFEPLEMFSTSYRYADLDMNKVATIYADPAHTTGFYGNLSYPAGSLKSTTEDFSHFIIAYMNGGSYKNTRILEEDTVNDILKVRNPASGLCLIWNCDFGNWYGHAGGHTGVAAYTEFQRDSHVGLFIVSTYRHHTVYPGNKTHTLVRRIANQYF